MRIVHVVPTYLPAVRYGGPIFAVHGLARAQAARGHAVEVFTTSIDGPANSAAPCRTPVLLDGVTVRYFTSTILRRLSYAPALARTLRRELPGADIVHLHSVFLWPTFAAARLARSARVPYVVSPRGMLVRQLIARRHRLIKSAWISLIEKRNLERASAVHVTSAVEATELETFGLALRRIALVPNGVDEVDALSGDPSEDVAAVARAAPLILFFGRLAWVKGLDRLLQAFARGTTGTLAIVGTDHEGLAPRLGQMARDLGIAERVRLVPRTVTGVDKELVYASAQVFVLPSISESFGNAALEAMRRGVAVVVTRDVGAAAVVHRSGGGIVVDGDAAQLGEAIERLAADAGLARAMGEAGRRHVGEHYGWPTVAAQMESLYESLREQRDACSTRSRP
jgi:glycosyltransferase involved in cell wall biosynthesis